MSEDLYAKVDLTKKVRFQTSEKEDRKTGVGDNIADVVIYDNSWVEERTQTPKPEDTTIEDPQQISVSPGGSNLFRPAAVFLGLLCLILMATIIGLVVYVIHENIKLSRENDGLQRRNIEMESLNRSLVRNISRLEREIDVWAAINNNLTNERDELKTNFSEMETLSHNLTQNLMLLKKEKENITNERDELQQRIEKRRCPANWKKFDNSCYLIPNMRKNWSDSKRYCESQDAQLVIISSIMEQVYLNSFGQRAWIGLTDEGSESIWKWVDGKPATEKYWHDYQPDNFGPNGENCAEIYQHLPLKNWNDIDCGYVSNFICEKTLPELLN